MADAFNEGVGHGGIAVNINNGPQGVIIDPWNVNRDTIKIKQPDQYGTSIKKAGRLINIDATGTAQLPVTINGATVEPAPLVEGMSFEDPNSGITYWISKAGQEYQSGQFWKQAIECEQQLNANI
jgi:hypothetical protein